MIWFTDDIRAVLWVATAPAFIAVFLLISVVREPESPERATAPRNRLTLTDSKRLPMRYWFVVALGAVFALARFSEAFLILRAQEVGLALGYVPMIMIVMNISYSIFAYPAGAAGDRHSARTLLVFGLAMLVLLSRIGDGCVAVDHIRRGSFLGLHMAYSGLLSKLLPYLAHRSS